jgi:putative colanic acid biosynthesis UDP-glucose lipid carrier transferase
MNMMSRNVVVGGHTDVVNPGFRVPSAHRKWPVRYASIEALAICADVAIILAAVVLTDLSHHSREGWTIADAGKAAGAAGIVAALFLSLLKAQRMHAPLKLLNARAQIRALCLSWSSTLLLLSGAVVLHGAGTELQQGPGLNFAAAGILMLITERLALKALLTKGLSEHRFAGGKALLISDQRSSGNGLRQNLAASGYHIVRQFNLPRVGASASHRLHLCSLVLRYAREIDIEDIIVETHPDRWCEIKQLIAGLKVLPVPVTLIPSVSEANLLKHPIRALGDAVGIELQSSPMTRGGRIAKRCLDLTGAALCLVVLLPLMIAVAVIIKMDSNGPILFRQRRCGFNGRDFTIYKFRTMTVLEDGPLLTQAAPADRRVTEAGRWLRQTSIDELPQLLNVLRGDMSLVGPRPHALAHDGDFDRTVALYAGRRRVKPGLTGWAQIHGFRGPTPTAACIEQRVGYDLWYIDNWSLLLDVAILLRTPAEVLRARNAF